MHSVLLPNEQHQDDQPHGMPRRVWDNTSGSSLVFEELQRAWKNNSLLEMSL